jgi:hypothetical protein
MSTSTVESRDERGDRGLLAHFEPERNQLVGGRPEGFDPAPRRRIAVGRDDAVPALEQLR